MQVVILFILVSIIGASGNILTKLALEDFPPVIIVFLRFSLAAVILLPFVLRKKIEIIPGTFKLIALSGIVASLNSLLFALGLGHTSVLTAQLMFIPSALLVAVIGFIFLKEKLSKNQIIGLLLTMMGMGILILGSMQAQDVLSLGKPLGNILIASAVLTWAFYIVVSRKLLKHYDPIFISFSNFIFAGIISLPFAMHEFNKGFSVYNVSQTGVLSILGLTFLASIAFYLIIQKLIKITSAFIGSLTMYGIFLTVSILGPIIFQEKIAPTFLIACAFIIPGVFIATRSGKISL